ncbi:hypothetical protein EJ04DRAFT_568860 [Neofusicoccum parvum]|nr:hypothetical protein EJ04DRAFT_568860 [Neofusicoccum parvum]
MNQRAGDLGFYSNAYRFTEDQHILLPWRIYGYALQDRKWHSLNVDEVNELEELTGVVRSPFDNLVLGSGHKRLIQALVKHQTRRFNHSSTIRGSIGSSNGPPTSGANINGCPTESLDLVRGKGRGLTILLHGVPGVGKTSTAEERSSAKRTRVCSPPST